MKLPSVPGPFDVLSAMGGVRDGVAEALALVPRVASAVGRMETLLDRVDGVIDRVDGIIDRADGVIAGVADTRKKADEAIAGVADTRKKADATIASVGATVSHAGDTVGRAEGLVGRLEPMLGDYEPALAALAPSVRRLADTLEPHEVEAMVRLIDTLPTLVTHLESDILPVLASLGDVGTDVHDLVDTMQDLREVVKGFPGSRLFRRRGAEEIAEEEAAGG